MAMSDYILKENFDLPMDTFAKDFAPWRNIMAAHGVEPYAKPNGPGKRHNAKVTGSPALSASPRGLTGYASGGEE